MRRNATHQLLKAGTKNCSASGSEELEPRRGEPMKRFSLMTGSLFCRFHRAPILVQIRTKPKSHFILQLEATKNFPSNSELSLIENK